MKKTCTRCGEAKATLEFYFPGDSWCKECRREAQRVRNRARDERRRRRPAPIEKVCNFCGEVKLLREFPQVYDRRRRKAYRVNPCSSCLPRRRREHREKMQTVEPGVKNRLQYGALGLTGEALQRKLDAEEGYRQMERWARRGTVA